MKYLNSLFIQQRCSQTPVWFILSELMGLFQESRKFRNFASMSAIVTALQSTTITGLGLTYDRIPRDARCMLEEMSGLLDPRHNHSAYRTVLKGSDNPCIPLFGMHNADCTCHEPLLTCRLQPSTYTICILLFSKGKT